MEKKWYNNIDLSICDGEYTDFAVQVEGEGTADDILFSQDLNEGNTALASDHDYYTYLDLNKGVATPVYMASRKFTVANGVTIAPITDMSDVTIKGWNEKTEKYDLTVDQSLYSITKVNDNGIYTITVKEAGDYSITVNGCTGEFYVADPGKPGLYLKNAKTNSDGTGNLLSYDVNTGDQVYNYNEDGTEFYLILDTTEGGSVRDVKKDSDGNVILYIKDSDGNWTETTLAGVTVSSTAGTAAVQQQSSRLPQPQQALSRMHRATRSA